MKYGYVRSATQNTNCINSQCEELQSLGVDKIIVEKIGYDIDNLLAQLKEGDSLYITSLDRLTRKSSEALAILKILFDNNIELYIGANRINKYDYCLWNQHLETMNKNLRERIERDRKEIEKRKETE